MSHWIKAIFMHNCISCKNTIWPGELMRFDPVDRPLCRTCGGWPL